MYAQVVLIAYCECPVWYASEIYITVSENLILHSNAVLLPVEIYIPAWDIYVPTKNSAAQPCICISKIHLKAATYLPVYIPSSLYTSGCANISTRPGLIVGTRVDINYFGTFE